MDRVGFCIAYIFNFVGNCINFEVFDIKDFNVFLIELTDRRDKYI